MPASRRRRCPPFAGAGPWGLFPTGAIDRLAAAGGFGGHALGGDADDVPDEAELLEAVDDQRRGVDLEAAKPVGGGGREGVVVVVPGLAEGRDRDQRQVARLVAGLEVAVAEDVAERVDAVGEVVEDEDADEPAPERAGGGGEEGAADDPAEEEGEQQAANRPPDEGGVDAADDRVLEQVRGEALLVAALGVDEEPAHVGVVEALEGAAPAVAVVDVGAVRVALDVGEGVVLAVVGDPGDDRALDRDRAGDRQQAVQPGLGLEGAVGEVAVEADGDPEAAEDVHAEEEEDVAPVQGAAPDLPAGKADRDEGDQRDQPGDDAVAGLVGDRLDVGGEWAGGGGHCPDHTERGDGREGRCIADPYRVPTVVRVLRDGLREHCDAATRDRGADSAAAVRGRVLGRDQASLDLRRGADLLGALAGRRRARAAGAGTARARARLRQRRDRGRRHRRGDRPARQLAAAGAGGRRQAGAAARRRARGRGDQAPSPPPVGAAAERPPPQQGARRPRRASPLRRLQRVLRALPRPDHGLQLRDLARRREEASGAGPRGAA